MRKRSFFFIVLLITSLSLNATLDTLFAKYIRMVPDEKAEFLLNRGIGYFNLNDYQKALEYLKTAQNKFNQTGNKEGISKCLNNLGNVYNNLGQYEKALEYHLRSLDIEQEIQNKNGMTRSLNNIGNVYQNTGDLEKALEFYLTHLLWVLDSIVNDRPVNTISVPENLTNDARLALRRMLDITPAKEAAHSAVEVDTPPSACKNCHGKV